MINVEMTRSQWDTVILILTDARDSERFDYFDDVTDIIDLLMVRSDNVSR